VVVSGTSVSRPHGIVKGPVFQPTERLDYELEVGFVLRGQHGRLSPDQAAARIFGVVLVNDWSARDIQAFEYKPLGPFLGKSFATSVGAWVTPIEALDEWRTPNQDSTHEVLPHLLEEKPNHFEIPLWASLETGQGDSERICSTNLRNLAWSAAQMVSHLTSNGTVITAGDLIATGTVSGPEKGAEACLLERTEGGKQPLSVGSQERTFLADGDTITLLGGHPGVGLAPCRGTITGETTE
jgi:fumarylacetoacetase